MIGLDTNVVVRYLTRDDQAQWQKSGILHREGMPPASLEDMEQAIITVKRFQVLN